MSKLFNMFNPVSAKAWKQKIQADLKGANYNDTLITKTNEGIDIKPFYNKEDCVDLTSLNNHEKWHIAQQTSSNSNAIEALNKGVDTIIFNVKNDFNVNSISIDNPFYLDFNYLPKQLPNTFLNNPNTKYLVDIVGNLAKTGNWYYNLKEDHTILDSFLKTSPNVLCVNASLYQNAGANIIQQLAYSLAHLNEYLNHVNNNHKSIEALNITFKISIGSNYFFEIAKLKALRILFSNLIKEYSFKANSTIIAYPTKRNKTIYDYNTNMLRTTTECMSAILGHANIICNLNYDAIYNHSNEFANRIARNQLLILKHESYFNTVNNASQGSYYIESITHQLATKALDLFKNIEIQGGFLKLLKSGVIQKKIKESAQKEQNQFNNQDLILLGTNKYINKKDKMKHSLQKDPFLKHNPRKTIIEPILEKRLSETLEKQRLQTELN